MTSRCGVCYGPQHLCAEVNRLLIDGMSYRDIERETGVGKNAVYRHRPHIDDQIAKARRAQDDATATHVTTLAARLASLADDAVDIRNATDDDRTKLAAIDSERRTLVTIADRLKIDSDDMIAAIGEARALALAVASLVRERPSLGNELAARLNDAGQPALADRFASLSRSAASVTTTQPEPRRALAR